MQGSDATWRVFADGSRRSITRTVYCAVREALGRDALVHLEDGAGWVRVSVAIGWRVWLPWVRRRARAVVEEATQRSVSIGAAVEINIRRRLPTPRLSLVS